MKLSLRILLIFAFLVLTLGIYNHVMYRYEIQDTIVRTLLFPLFETSWAKDFEETNFCKITIGMNKETVVAILGQPLRETCEGICEWVYSWQADPTASFDRRAIYFDNLGIVVKTRKDLFLD